jgi:hypothetical protein
MATGFRKVEKFMHHVRMTAPGGFVDTHYHGLDDIAKQTGGKADWFLAELKDADGSTPAGTLHLIYCPTDGTNPIITPTLKVKLCAAPEPPFQSEDTPDYLNLLIEIEGLLNTIKQNMHELKSGQ